MKKEITDLTTDATKKSKNSYRQHQPDKKSLSDRKSHHRRKAPKIQPPMAKGSQPFGNYSGKTERASNLILNLNDYLGNMEELIQTILRKANPEGDLKYLEELYVIKDGKIMDIFE